MGIDSYIKELPYTVIAKVADSVFTVLTSKTNIWI